MKTMINTLLVVTIVALPAFSQSGTTREAKPAQSTDKDASTSKIKDYYPLKVGTKWHYQLDPGNGQKVQITSQIGGIESIGGKDLARLEVLANGRKLPATEYLQRTERGVFRVRMNNVEITPPICLIKYPLKEGQSWGGETATGEQRMKVECSEGKSEEINVPAGKYRAVPCTVVVIAGGAKFTNVFWFAEDVGIVKQRTEIGPQVVVMELTKYEPAH
jgi:hypothetical protein